MLLLSNKLFVIFFFGCVAVAMWSYLADIFQIILGNDYESVVRWWVRNKKHKVLNSCSATLMWTLWKFRNEMCFQGTMLLGRRCC